MPTTSPDNIYYADGATAMSAESISAAEATSVQAALDSLINETRQVKSYIWANAAARSAQTGMVEGAIGYQSDTNIYYTYSGSAWLLLFPAPTRVIPSSVTNGSFDSTTGVVTSTAQSLVRVRDAFPSGFTVFQIDYDITTSVASTINVRLAVGATDAATAYDNQRFTMINATATSVQALNQPELQLSPIALIARHVGRLIIHGPNLAAESLWNAQTVVTPNPMTTASGISMVSGQHRTATAYNSFSISPASGTLTINKLTVTGVS